MPTVTIGDQTGADFAGAEDCRIDFYQPNTSNNSGELEIVQNGAAYPAKAPIKFSGLSNITGPVTVSSATLYLYLIQQGTFDTATITLRRLLRNWVDSQATWNIFSTGNSWGTAGALGDGTDRVATASAQNTSVEGVGQYFAFTSAQLATDVQNIINGVNANYGWLLEMSSDTNFKKFASDSYGTAANRPYLSVTYEAASGASPAIVSVRQSPARPLGLGSFGVKVI